MAGSAATPYHPLGKGMALATKCPHCKTTFRVASDQLKLRGGIVRCGTCHQVFDGNASLVDRDARAPAPAPAPPTAPAPLVPLQAPDPAALADPALPCTDNDNDNDGDIVAVPEPEPEELGVPELEFSAAPAAAPAAKTSAGFILEVDPDFDAKPEPAPEPEDDYIASAGDAFDALVTGFDEQAPELPKRGHYVLDFDLSDPTPAPAGPDPSLAPAARFEDDVVPEPEPFVEAEFNPPPEELPEPEPFVEEEFDPPDEPLPEPEAFNEAEFYAQPEPEPGPEPVPFSASEFGAAHNDGDDPLSAAEAPGASFWSDVPNQPAQELDLETGPLPLLRASADDQPFAFEPPASTQGVAVASVAQSPEDADEPEFMRLARDQELAARRRRLIMGAGSALLALVLLVQSVTIFRNVLVAKYPAIRTQVSAVCELLRCTIELPAQIEAITVETGEFQTLSPAIYRYSTVLRNDSGLVQAWPHLELALKDGAKVVVRRVFTPVQYLPQGVAPAKGFAPQSEQAVTINFELKQLAASGFSIAVFYP